MKSAKTHQAAIIEEVIKELQKAVTAQKCWSCGCFHNSLDEVERIFPEGKRPVELDVILCIARECLTPIRYDCLGCDICYPALISNAIDRLGGEHPVELKVCRSNEVEERHGWPPLPGNYTVLRYRAPVAVCTLTEDELATSITHDKVAEIAIVGTLQTENLGIERLLLNVIANPNIRFLVVCGADSRQAVGHLPGQSLVALSRWGIDDKARIIEAKGNRPILRNLAKEAVEHFRRTVEVIDLIGNAQVSETIDVVRDCARRFPGPAEPFASERLVVPLVGYLPDRMISDPAGYFVVFVDRPRQLIALEHYQMDGVLDMVIEGKTAAELYIPAIEKKLVSRLDHAAYLGRELARAEQSLLSGGDYVQDAAPESCAPAIAGTNCSCGTSCSEVKS